MGNSMTKWTLNQMKLKHKKHSSSSSPPCAPNQLEQIKKKREERERERERGAERREREREKVGWPSFWFLSPPSSPSLNKVSVS